MPKNSAGIIKLLPLFLIILIDVMGMVLVLPVLVPLILKVDGSIVSPTMSLIMRDFTYGLTLALYPFTMFFSTPVLGDLSDKFGRKKILLLCLLLTTIGYFVSAIGIYYHDVLLFLFSRMITGLAAGTQSIASAALIDLSDSSTKTRNLSGIVLVGSIGVIIGPLMGGLTAEKDLLSWFSYETPFIIAACLSLLNAVLLQFSYQETHVTQSGHKIQLSKGFVLFLGAFKEPKFRLLAITTFCFVLAWCLYYQAISWLFMQTFHYSVGQLGVFIGYIGIIFAFASTFVTRITERFFAHEVNTYLFFAMLMMIANIGCVLSSHVAPQWFWVILNASGNIVCYTLALSLFSNLVSEDAQGWIMGVVGSICAITWTFGGLIAGPLGYLDIRLPIITSAILSLTCFITMFLYKRLYYHRASSDVG